MSTNAISEKEEIEKAKLDARMFEPLYLRYYEQIIKFVYKRVDDIEDCREITAVVFAKAIGNIRSYKHQGFPFSSWLYRIAINEITEFYRHKAKTRIISYNEKTLNSIIEETGENKKELISVLKKALLYLKEEELNLIELRYFEERSFAEVGGILGISEGNAKIKTYRVLNKLKTIYNKL